MTRTRREAGAANIEYVGIIVAVVALVAALAAGVSALGVPVVDRLRCAVESLGSQAPGVCGSDVEPVTYDGDGDGDGRTSGGPLRDPPPGGGTGSRYQNATGDITPVSQAAVEAAVDDLDRSLDPGGWGVLKNDLDRALEALEGLTPAEIDAVIAQMSDEDLARWVDQMEDGWLQGGWSADERRELWELLTSTASKQTLDRFARFTDELEPEFDKVGTKNERKNPDHVANTGQYGELSHELFVDGADPRDVGQGALGDCWWIASMMAVAQADPSIIEEAITANPNGSYTVRLYEKGKPVYVTVTPEMVLLPDGTPAFVGNDRSGSTYELWPMVLEKALAIHYGDFDDIEGNTADRGLTALTGLPSSNTGPGKLSITDLQDVLDHGGAIGLSSLKEKDAKSNPLYAEDVSDRLYPGHAYYVSEVNVKDGTVTVTNPWGIASAPPITLTYDEFVSGFRQVRTNEVNR